MSAVTASSKEFKIILDNPVMYRPLLLGAVIQESIEI